MVRTKLKIAIWCGLLGGLLLLFSIGSSRANTVKPESEAVPLAVSTADHSRFPELDKPFASGPEVTRACLKCHNRAGEQFKKSIHWTWEAPDEKGKKVLGKAHVLNNY